MKRFLLILTLVSSASIAIHSSEPSGPWALVFSLQDVLSTDAFIDGYQAGAGLKYRLSPDLDLRGLLGIDHNANAGVTRTVLGFGTALEWHFSEGSVSPYAGPLTGARMLFETGQPGRVDLYFGALFGAEIKVAGPLYLFAEYDLVASFDADGFTVRLGIPSGGLAGAQAGFIVRF